MRLWAGIVGLMLGALLFVATPYAQFLNAAHLSVVVRGAERVFDNGGNPWPFFQPIPGVAYNSGLTYVATPNAACAVDGSSYRADYINFKTDTGQTPAFRLGCFLQGYSFRYTTNVSTPGPYVINITMSNGGGSAATISILVDGGAPVATAAIGLTGDYNTFSTFTSSQFNMSQANHVITIVCTAGDSSANACGDLRSFVGANPAPAGVPGPAAAAGFTVLAINTDFTDSGHSAISQWLGGCGAGGNPEWWTGWVGFGAGPGCGAYSMAADTAKGVPQAFRMQWLNSYLGTSGNFTPIETIKSDVTAGRMFVNYYTEAVLRLDTLNSGMWADFWSTGTFGGTSLDDGGTVEWDGYESLHTNTDQYGTTIHNYGDGDNCGGHWCSGTGTGVLPDTEYHRFAWRVTGVLGSGYTLCSYYENTPFSSGLQLRSCVTMTGSAAQDHLSGAHVATAPIIMIGTGANQATFSTPPVLWIKSARVYVCPSWSGDQRNIGGAQACYSTSQPPP